MCIEGMGYLKGDSEVMALGGMCSYLSVSENDHSAHTPRRF